MTDAPRRRWFRFSLRTFFVVLTIFGIWLGVQVKWIRDRHEFLARQNGRTPPRRLLFVCDNGDAAAPWSIRFLGERGIYGITVADVDHATETRIKGLFPEAWVEVNRWDDEDPPAPQL